MWRRKGGGEGERRRERREERERFVNRHTTSFKIIIHSHPLYNTEAEVFRSWGFPLGYHTEVFRSLGCLG